MINGGASRAEHVVPRGRFRAAVLVEKMCGFMLLGGMI
jgi:hypothetical protein